jgi:acetyl-CoA acetyltransferase
VTRTLSNKAVIAGIGQTEFSKDSGRSELQLAAEAVKAALDDAGLTPAEVDGMVTFVTDANEEIEVGPGRATHAGHRPVALRPRRIGTAGMRALQVAVAVVDSWPHTCTT